MSKDRGIVQAARRWEYFTVYFNDGAQLTFNREDYEKMKAAEKCLQVIEDARQLAEKITALGGTKK